MGDGRENLIPTSERSKDEARALGRAGGIKSGEVRREKKRMADIYAGVLAREFDVKNKEGQKVTKTGADLVEDVIFSVVKKRNGTSVSMIREMREGIDGSKVEHSGSVDLSTLTQEEFDARLKAFLAENQDKLVKND